MSLKFSTFCSLLSDLEDIELRDPPLIKPQKLKRISCLIEDWFRSRRSTIDGLSVDEASALLSAFLPEWRTDRVYGIQAPGLCRTIGRLLNLGGARLKDLQAYREPGRGDLGECVERIQRSGGVLASPPLTLKEVDAMLENQASRSKFSDNKSVPSSSAAERNQLLGNVLLRASPVECKWLVRLLLKDLSPVRIDQDVLRCFHFLLPDLLRFQHNFKVAIIQLRGQLAEFPAYPDARSAHDYRIGAADKLQPQVGVKVGRPEFQKCRGIDHCMNIVQDKQWVLERKYDGEYCEVHVDLVNPQPQWIKIYSKSGKDSTEDREGIHSILMKCLRLGNPDCKIKRRAILLGELIVYSDRDGCIMPFEEIRKHVKRSGQFVGTSLDSQPPDHEHLAIVFFDLLLWDDEIVMTKSVEQRRLLLRQIYIKQHGRAMGAEWKVIDFSQGEQAKRRFIEQFAASNTQRCEGLILKPMGVPYFPLSNVLHAGQQCIKLKKDYIDGMADEADFAVVGASYNAQIALKRCLPNLRWTSFHLACLTNKEDVVRFDAKPEFRYVASIEDESCIPVPVLTVINLLGPFVASGDGTDDGVPNFNLKVPHAVRIDVRFRQPFVFEVIGSGFVKPSNCAHLMLRHPRVKKLHQDRDWRSCISFQELQEQASAARLAPVQSESQETRMWIEKLERSCKRKFDRNRVKSARQETSSVETESTPSTPQVKFAQTAPPPPIMPTHAVKRTPDVSTDSAHRAAKVRRILAAPNTLGMVASTSNKDSSPLAEITNTSLARLNNVASTRTPSTSKWPKPRINPPPLSATPIPPCGPTCLFASSTVLLAPCIRSYLYVSEDLLPTHDVTVVDRIEHWDRDSFSRQQQQQQPLAETVSESQAYPGLRKIVLVEGRRRVAVLETIEGIRNLNEGKLRERIEVYDWRVLEECGRHDRGADRVEEERWFVGAGVWDEALGRAVWVEGLE